MVRCAAKKGIKTAIHEQNAFPGVTNKLLAPDVDIVFAAVPAAVEKRGFDPVNIFYIFGVLALLGLALTLQAARAS